MNINMKEKQPLVSVVTPCHNSEKYIGKLLDSILAQSWPNVEMYTIDNESSDRTAEIIQTYIPKFLEKGYSLTYVHQKDVGPSAGLQTGLNLIHGDYLVCPDSDDYYINDKCFERAIKAFQQLPDDYAMVRWLLNDVNEDTGLVTQVLGKESSLLDGSTFFEDCLFGRNGWYYVTIGFMFDVAKLKQVSDLKIYTHYYSGPNRQLTLPLLYKNKCYTIQEPLAVYLTRQNSESHAGYAKYQIRKSLYEQAELYFDGIFSQIPEMPIDEKLAYKKQYMQKSTRSIIEIAINAGNVYDVLKYRLRLQKYGGSSFKNDKSLLKKVIKIVLKKN